MINRQRKYLAIAAFAACAIFALTACEGEKILSDEKSGFNISDASFEIGCVRYVNVLATGNSDGLSWENAFTKVQEGIDSAATAFADTGETCQVWVAAGTYYVYNSKREDTIKLATGVRVLGGFAGSESTAGDRDWRNNVTILDGHEGPVKTQQVYHVVFSDGDGVIDGFTITGGRADSELSDGSNLGGGIFVATGKALIANCKLEGNTATLGEFLGGGGIAVGYEWGDSNTIPERSPTIVGCTFANNSGKALYASASSPTVIGSLFSGNPRGAILINDSQMTITNCTFADNGDEIGSAITFEGEASMLCPVSNIIAWDSYGEPVYDYENVVTVSYSIVHGGYPGEGNIDADPLFVDLANGDFHLRNGSPCIDAADGESVPERDLDGNHRVNDPNTSNTGIGPPWADIGAYEFQPKEKVAEFCWVKNVQVSSEVMASDSFEDGAVVIVGSIPESGAVFGEGEANETSLDPDDADFFRGFIAKYKKDGLLDWAVLTDGVPDWVEALADGGVLVAGLFDPSLPSDEFLYDAHVAKFDTDGELAWSVKIAPRFELNGPHGGTSRPTPFGLDLLSDDSIIVTAAFVGDIVLGQGEKNETALSSGSDDTAASYIAHYNLDGLLDWACLTESTFLPLALAVRQDGVFAVISEGNFISEDGAPSSVEDYLSLYDSGGTLLCSVLMTQTVMREYHGMGWTANGDLFVGGTFYSEIAVEDSTGATASASAPVVDEGSIVTYMGELFMARFGSDGALVQLTTVENDDIDNVASGTDLDLDSEGGVLITGYLAGAVTFGQGEIHETVLTSEGTTDTYLARYFSDGTLDWTTRLATITDETRLELHSIAAIDDGSVVVSGSLDGNATLNLINGESVTFSSAGGLMLVAKVCW